MKLPWHCKANLGACIFTLTASLAETTVEGRFTEAMIFCLLGIFHLIMAIKIADALLITQQKM